MGPRRFRWGTTGLAGGVCRRRSRPGCADGQRCESRVTANLTISPNTAPNFYSPSRTQRRHDWSRRLTALTPSPAGGRPVQEPPQPCVGFAQRSGHLLATRIARIKISANASTSLLKSPALPAHGIRIRQVRPQFVQRPRGRRQQISHATFSLRLSAHAFSLYTLKLFC